MRHANDKTQGISTDLTKRGKNQRNIPKPSKYYRKTRNQQKQQEQQHKIQLAYIQTVLK